MTIPHHHPQEPPARTSESGAGEPREPGAPHPGPVTYDDAARRYGPGTIGARERHDELSMRDHLARAYARLRASGEYDAATHGTRDTEPLTAAEHLELLATAEYLARAYQPSSRQITRCGPGRAGLRSLTPWVPTRRPPGWLTGPGRMVSTTCSPGQKAGSA